MTHDGIFWIWILGATFCGDWCGDELGGDMGGRFRVMMRFEEFNTNFDLDLIWIYDVNMLQFFSY